MNTRLYEFKYETVNYIGMKILAIRRVPTQDTPFSTRNIIGVNNEVLSQLSQPMYILFSYLNSVQHNSVIELCHEQIFFHGS